jgi:CBS domain-containing protein
MKKCKKVMTKNPICCLSNDYVGVVAKMMKRENIGAIPVINDIQSRNLVGIVTDRDLALKVVGESRNTKSIKVVEIMSCLESDDIQKALDEMSKHQIRRIPIVDKDNKIVGILSQADMATRIKQPKKTANLLKNISQQVPK